MSGRLPTAVKPTKALEMNSSLAWGQLVDRRRRRLVSLPHQATILAEGDAALTSSYGRDRGNR
jgi:hypothetical protein